MTPSRQPAAAPDFAWLPDEGEMCARIRALDWAKTPVGPVDSWPQSLRIALGIVAGSRYPMFVWWKEQLTFFYNDAYIPMLGQRHPAALGQPADQVWHEIWPALGPQVAFVLGENRATWNDRMLLIMERNGYPEESYFTFSYSPVPTEDGRPGGVFCACSEDTLRALAERRLQALRQLADRTAEAHDAAEACRLAAACLELHPRDVSFAFIYLLDRDGSAACQAARTRGVHASAHAPDRIRLEDAASATWPFLRVARGERITLTDLGALGLPGGDWPEPTHTVMLLPLAQAAETTPHGFIVLGASPRREFDDDYKGFFELVAAAIASAIGKARSYAEARQRAEALAELDRAKTAFFSNVSHEFRTPLTLMLGPLEEWRGRARHAPARVARAEIDAVHRNSLRLLKLVNALLDFSRIEAGRAQAAYEPADLAALTTDLASVFRSAMTKAGLDFHVACAPLPQPVWIDPDLWEQIVFNLLSNALKFTLQGAVQLSLQVEGPFAVLRVRDTGLGIAASELPNLFKRFHRIANMRGRTHEGTGIGLALVHELVKLHGGTLGVTSEPGRGSEFMVRLPFGHAHLPQERVSPERSRPGTRRHGTAFVEEALSWLPASEASPDGPPPEDAREPLDHGSLPPHFAGARPSGARILLADDNADMRAYVQRLLRPLYEVEAVPDGEAALAAARRQAPDLIVSDVMMPAMNGFELVQHLRADDALRSTPVVLLSARAGEEARLEGAAQGADDYLTKPFSARELLARVALHLELARVRRREAAAIEREKRRLLDLLEHAPACVCLLRGPDHVYSLANRLYLQLVDRPSEAIVGRSVRTALPELDGQGFFELLDRVYATGEPFVGDEMPVRLARGGQGALEERFVNFVYQPIPDGAGAIDGVLVHAIDVTAQVRARRQVEELAQGVVSERDRARASEERAHRQFAELDGLYRSAPVGLAFVDRELRFVRINEMLATINGVPVDRTVGRTLREVLPSMADKLEPSYHEVLATGRAVRFEVEGEMPTAPGVRRNFVVSDYPVADAFGQILGVGCVVREVTERRQAERALQEAHTLLADKAAHLETLVQQRTARLRESIAELEAFSYSIAHDLRAPLRSLRGFSDALLSDHAGSLDAEGQDYLRRIAASAARMDRLIQDVLSYSRVVRGESPVETVDIGHLLRDIAESYPMLAPDKANLVFEGTFPPVRGGEALLTQVFSNLLGNAAKFVPPGARPDIRVWAETRGAKVCVFIRDRGIGIAPEHQERIFGMFEQLGKAYEGTGIGLAIVKKAVERMGGAVGVDSQPGQGSTFWIELPRA